MGLVDYARCPGMVTTTKKWVALVLMAKPDSSVRKQNFDEVKDADENFQNKAPILLMNQKRYKNGA